MGFLEAFEPLYKILPEVKVPEVQPPLKKRLMWTGAVLVLFFIMGNVAVIGLEQSSFGRLEQLQLILASKIGTLLTVGIGPIVLASIILQLLVGSKIIKVDFSNPLDKARFTSAQKLFAIVLSFFEGFVYVFSGFLAPMPGMLFLVVLQVAVGAIAIIYLDEIVSKYGVGSGIGIFIAGGVSEAIIWRIFNPVSLAGAFDPLNGTGLIFVFLQEAGRGLLSAITLYLLPIFFTLAVFFVVVYAEGMHVNIPITMGRRGAGGRFPVKFLYVSNIPVILAVALFANIQLWALMASDTPVLGTVIGGIAAITLPPTNLLPDLIAQFGYVGIGQFFGDMVQSVVSLQFIGLGGQFIHAFLYIVVLAVACVIFGKFWVEMAGQGPDAVAEQLQRSGMYIPGFRRDPRIIRKILGRYIPPITILGSLFVGLLAGLADLTGAIGTGTGILLTVGIVYRLYEELARQQLFEMHPALSKIFG